MNSGNKSEDPESFATHNGNWGISAGLNIPLDGNLMDLCRRRASVEIARQQAETDKIIKDSKKSASKGIARWFLGWGVILGVIYFVAKLL